MTHDYMLPEQIEPHIRTFRSQKVILDCDLARIYGVPTKRLNEQVVRNARRFPADFVFRLTAAETEQDQLLRSQFATLKHVASMRSQFATASAKRNMRFLPYAFTEHGAIMAATVLNTPQAVEMSVFVVRAFVKMRDHLATTRELALRLAEIEKQLVVHDTALVDLYERLRPLLLPPEDPPDKRIGFSVREARAKYGAGNGNTRDRCHPAAGDATQSRRKRAARGSRDRHNP